ncbi:Predicted AAA-ATPase [bacterium A37T11]|nr:Predicted AAA-ATPase [bacterium A37T11]
MRKYPIGIQNFRKVREGGYLYVDKTEIIHRLVTTGEYYFLSRPRRFGKSLMVDTLEELFSGSKELFEGLWIYDHWDWTKKNPVIHFNFAEIPYKEVGLQEALKIELERNAKFAGVVLETATLQGRFRELIEKVAQSKGPIILLIDEYDKPLIDFLDVPITVDENRSVLKSFYSVLKGQDKNIRLMLLTGVSRFSKVSLFSDLNQLSDITLVEEMNDLVGITQKELETNFPEDLQELAEKFNKSVPEIYAQVKKWYNGYSWGGANTLYNPFSLLSLFRWKQFDNFWIHTGTPAFFSDMIRRNPGLKFPDGEVEAGPEALIDLFNQKTEYDGQDSIRPITIMFQTGYLTVKHYDPALEVYTLDFPNREVKLSMELFLL